MKNTLPDSSGKVSAVHLCSTGNGIADVLNLTRVENQTILTNVTEYNLSEQLRACVLLLENKWSKKNLDFSMDFPEYQICANEELLRQVWINLLDNAQKHHKVMHLGVNACGGHDGNVGRLNCKRKPYQCDTAVYILHFTFPLHRACK